MKARVKATGNIVDVEWYGHDSMGTIYADVTHTTKYYEYELDFDTVYDYWARFEHQAAIAAMQGILSNPNITHKDISIEIICNHVPERVKEIAHALVEKMKEEK